MNKREMKVYLEECNHIQLFLVGIVFGGIFEFSGINGLSFMISIPLFIIIGIIYWRVEKKLSKFCKDKKQ